MMDVLEYDNICIYYYIANIEIGLVCR